MSASDETQLIKDAMDALTHTDTVQANLLRAQVLEVDKIEQAVRRTALGNSCFSLAIVLGVIVILWALGVVTWLLS